jgi:Cof subfamily protein (haloacid dehalogenase superfamily)
LSNRTRAALREVERRGMTVVFVSARSPRSVSRDAADAGVTGFAICANGATLFDLDEERIVEHNALPSDVASSLVRRLRERVPGVCFGCERELGFSHEPAYERGPHAHPAVQVADALELVSTPVTKLVARHSDVELTRLAEIALELAGETATVTVSGTLFVEISAAGVTKAFAVERLAGRLGVDRDEVIAFGDMPNDVPMLTWAGRSVAVANAHPDALAAASEVTASNDEDGVAQVLEKL